MLVASLRAVERLTDLTHAEVADLFCLAQRVSDVAQKQFKACSVTLAVQDGIDAGQTIKVGLTLIICKSLIASGLFGYMNINIFCINVTYVTMNAVSQNTRK